MTPSQESSPRDADQVGAAGAVLDDDQRVDAPEQRRVHVDEVGRENAACVDGQELLPGRAAAAECGADPGVVQDLPDGGGGDPVGSIVWVSAAPAKAEAHVFEAMAAIPGVTADAHATTIAGQPAIGVSANGGESVLFLDPQTYHVIGLKAKTTPFMKSTKSGPPMTYGTLSMAYEKVALVNQPGDR